ncbi:MAG: aldehyde dehydrogenase, partial [Anaerolineae bacterium]|nr:aldehyde dehydrogenase [Anaerolineae bacterium]
MLPIEQKLFPVEIPNWISGEERLAQSGDLFDKLNPANGQRLSRVARSRAEDVQQAVTAARQA